MRRTDYSALRRSQQSAFYYSDVIGKADPVLQNRPQYDRELYPHMLAEDLSLGLLPTQRGDRYSVGLEPNNPLVAEILAFALSGRDYHGGDLENAIYEFFSEVARSLAYYGECVYEFVDLMDPTTEEIKAFDLSFIQPLTVFQQTSQWIQYVPEAVAVERGIPQRIMLPTDRLLVFHLPGEFRDGYVWMNLMRSLASLSQIAPEFGWPKHDSNKEKVPFNFMQHAHLRDQVVASVTRTIGWNMRKYPPEGMLEYYWFHRLLLFEKFKIEMRESILTTLNDGLGRIGEKLGLVGRISLAGLPTLEDIRQAQHDLETGQLPAKELLDRFKTVF